MNRTAGPIREKVVPYNFQGFSISFPDFFNGPVLRTGIQYGKLGLTGI